MFSNCNKKLIGAVLRTRGAIPSAVPGKITNVRYASRLYDSVLDTIGDTPIVKVNNIGVEGVELYAKLEYFNPLSSVKDRLALAIIEDAERAGKLKPGDTVVEATSGNTGIAMAMVCAQKGYNCVITMAEPFSVERRKVMRALGAKVIITPAAEKGLGMVKKAKELSEKHGWFLAKQFENSANARFHANTTGPEIIKAFNGRKKLSHWVTGYGTGGTFLGAGTVLKAAIPDLKIVLAEPANASLVTSGTKSEYGADGSALGSHPAFTPHPIQGWTPDFISKLTQEGVDAKLVDQVLPIPGPEAIATSLKLASKEGIFTGISGGATFGAALEVAKTAPKGSVILAMIPDTGERYLSTPLFASIEADMNDDELSISQSTPHFQLKNN